MEFRSHGNANNWATSNRCGASFSSKFIHNCSYTLILFFIIIFLHDINIILSIRYTLHMIIFLDDLICQNQAIKRYFGVDEWILRFY